MSPKPVTLEDMVPGGVLSTDVCHVKTFDYTCSRYPQTGETIDLPGPVLKKLAHPYLEALVEKVIEDFEGIEKMPIPEPGENEDRQTFLNRCMADDTMRNEFPDTGQRFAVCRSQWEEGSRNDERRGE